MENKIKTNCLIVNPSYFFYKHIIQEPFETGGKEVLNHISKVNYKTTIITHCILMLSIFKEEILKNKVLPLYFPLIAIDDEIENINMFKRNNILVNHYTKLRKDK